ncbi:hypothetical protein COR50_02280 [Chitinophaga caeni]|uniref:Alpha-2-macroglobulin n=1 Tax=Chitinophaga caeni TaxID=2029983 RepID=A0A291QQH0_9BACT|nr:MG2 domain-containing protein [Chitinophaga caeni]ATL46084.1 hypothetical protein COR50_02280 [Chitinophaga caeni]
MRPNMRYLLVSLWALIILLGFHSCKQSQEAMNPEFAKYIEAYTTGVISKQSAIRIQLNGQTNITHTVNEPLEEKVFDFSPSIKGKAVWIDATTIEFRPEENLQPGKKYSATFNLGKLMEVPKDLNRFSFDFQVMKPSYSFEEFGLVVDGNTASSKMKLEGVVYTADVEKPAEVERLLKASANSQSLPITWTHTSDPKEHKFTIKNITRGKTDQNLIIDYNGESIGSKTSGTKTLPVPASGVFKVMETRAMYEPDVHMLVLFSAPIDPAQDLRGLIYMSGVSDLRFTVDGSQVKVYSNKNLEGNHDVSISEGILDTGGDRLGKTFASSITFENRKPSVSVPSKGVILPQSQKLVLPFDAINLNAVDVTILKIYENNIPQYLQNNNLDGNNELRRVAKPIVRTTIRLDQDKSLNLHVKNRFNIDLEKYLNSEPGAIYRVTIGFRKEYALVKCNEKQADSDDNEVYYYDSYGDKIDDEDDFWSAYDSYYPYGYNWDQRDNPCHPAYYNANKWVSRNIISSNIGLIAKRGNDNSMVVAVTDIRDAKPMNGVDLELLDYQQQVIFTAKSDGEGFAKFDLPKKPYLLIAKKGNERGYLKLDDGNSLLLSRFDVKGEKIQSGMKGFIYGERGVWRPGDSLFLTFVLEDKNKKLPANHPVSFELYNPKGQLYKRIIHHESLNGFYKFATATDPDALTGNWVAKVKVGNATFTKNVRIETVKPNRLKINLDFNKNGILSRFGNNTGTLSAMWLFGAPGKDLKAKVDVSLVAAKTSFPQKALSDFVFDDPTTHFSAENKTIFEGSLGESGQTTIKADMNVGERAPGVLRANFETKVFEPGGDFSVDYSHVPYHVFKSYVGIQTPEGARLTGMLLTDKNHKVNIVNVDDAGNFISGQRTVSVEMYKVNWRWWWDEGEDDLTNFTQDNYNQLIASSKVTLNNGKGSWNFNVPYPQWGRFLIRVKDMESGHVTGNTVYVDWPGYSERLQKENPTEAAMLVFTSDKTHYKVGDEITLTIPSSDNGRALISIESGSAIQNVNWIKTSKGQTIYKFKATKEMSPNVYVNVSLLQAHAQTANDLPIRMYGTIPIIVEDPETILKPVVALPNTMRPESDAKITVSEANGKAMTYTIAIVDEGLLDLTRFKTPDPHAAFYAREALGVKTWDLFDYVIGAWGGDLERILSIGGDQNLNRNSGEAKANRFKPVVTYMGPYYLGKGQKQTHAFKLPQYIGSVKAMVVAGQDGAYGSAEKTASVKKPLMVLSTVPRVLGPGETIRLPVTVFGLESQIKSAQVTLQPNGLFEVIGSATQTVQFSQPGEQLVYFDVKVKAATGIGKFNIVAKSGKEQASESIELDVRNPNPFVTNIIEKDLNGGESWNTEYHPVGTEGTNTAVLEVSTIPSLNLGKRLEYLIRYPHGCIEQTTSGVFPQLYLSQIMDLSDKQKADIDYNVKAGLERLKSFQVTDGGFAYWPGNAQADEWGTNYAGHFMLEAKASGYTLPASLLEQWRKYQRNKAVTWAPNTRNFYGGDLAQSYRLYLLALGKTPEIGAMNRLKEFQYISNTAKWYLAAAYKLAGQPDVANNLVKGLSTDVKPYNQMGYTYGSDLRDKAIILQTLTILGKRTEALGLLKEIASNLSQDRWYSTQTTAYSLIAIATYCGQNKTGAKQQFDYTINGKKASVNADNYVTQIEIPVKGGNVGNVAIHNKGQNVLYARLILRGQPESGTDPYASNDPEVLDMSVRYHTRDGKALDPASLHQGRDFVATVTIRNPGKRGYYEQMALSQVFPSGWEILNTRLMGSDSSVHTSQFTYQDIRDDRVYTYFNLEEGKTVTYQVLLNASYLGKYYLPATTCEAMYDNTIHAFVPGKWVEVVK